MADSTAIPIDQLAAEAKKDEQKHILPPVPIAVLITAIVILALGAVAAPLGAILGTSSQTSIDSLSSSVLSQAVDLVFVQVQESLYQPKRMLNVLLDDKTLENAMLNNFNNLANETSLYFLMYNMIMSSPFLSGVSCPSRRVWTNTTFVSGYRLDGGANIALWTDWTTNGFLYRANYNDRTNKYDLGVRPNYEFPWNVVLLNTALHVYKPQSYLALGTLGHTTFVSESMLANNVPYTLYSVNYTDPYKSVTQFTVATTNDTIVRAVGSKLRSIYGNFTKIPNRNRATTLQTDVNGQQWLISTRYLTEPNDWLLIVAIPRSDFFGEIDAATRRVLAICISIAVIGIGFVALISFFALQPLGKLAKAMESLTKLDFSALEGNILNERSGVTEVRRLQTTFSIMCKAFASGIRKNKALVSGGANTGMKSTLNPPSTNSSHNA
ncbi:hypothetical protein BC829DRAFT_420437 [Chytridium lagenaria]|nr:hypothetical protein BC829DRAFT_420437 [Chytridium lagenaria]